MCEYCKEGQNLINSNSVSDYIEVDFKYTRLIVAFDSNWESIYHEVKINYCPVCGMELGSNNGGRKK